MLISAIPKKTFPAPVALSPPAFVAIPAICSWSGKTVRVCLSRKPNGLALRHVSPCLSDLPLVLQLRILLAVEPVDFATGSTLSSRSAAAHSTRIPSLVPCSFSATVRRSERFSAYCNKLISANRQGASAVVRR